MPPDLFHFDLQQYGLTAGTSAFAKIHGKRYPLRTHTATTLERLGNTNATAAALLEHRPGVFTHFLEVPAVQFAAGRVHRLTVVGVADDEDPENHLPPLYYVGRIYNREEQLHYLRQLHRTQGAFTPALLRGIDKAGHAAPTGFELHADSYALMGPLDTAIHLASQHPRLQNVRSQVSLRVDHQHVYPLTKTDPESINQLNNIELLVQALREQGPKGFTTIERSVAPNGTPMSFGFDVKDVDGKVIRKQGDAILHYKFTQKTELFMKGTLGIPLQTTRNDAELRGSVWEVDQGQTAVDHRNTTVRPPSIKRRALAAVAPARMGATPQTANSTNYQVSPNTSCHGIRVDSDSIQTRPANGTTQAGTEAFSVDVYNKFMRSVGGYVQFFADANFEQPIDNPTDWKEQLFGSLIRDFETDSKKYAAYVSAVNSIMGIPVSSGPTTLEFNWPADAQAARLLFGGIGTSNSQAKIIWPGVISTSIFNFALPTFMMIGGAAVTSTKWYQEFAKDTAKLLGLGAAAGFAQFGITAGVSGIKAALISLADTAVGLIFGKGAEWLAERIILRVSAAEVIDNVPFAGWAIRAASMALDAALLATTLGEVLSSPAVIEVEVKRQMKLTLQLHPDPKHGEAGNPGTAIWPAVGSDYRILVNYKNGSSFEAKGKLPTSASGGPSSQPVTVEFTVPWGGKLQVLAGIYSPTGWLCGKYDGAWELAVPDAATAGQKTISASITEQLVPLTADTQYAFKWKTGYDTEKGHYWWGADAGAKAPSSTVSSLSSSPTGNNISELGGITINRSAYVIGYNWRGSREGVGGSGQAWVFQNLSVLEKPESRLKFPTTAFDTKPGLAYDLYGGTETTPGPLNFVIDTRHGSNGYLRRVDLLDGKPDFGLAGATKSYGVFTLGDIDDVAIHPKGYVVAVNWNSHRLQVLPLPAAPVDDADAPQAVVCANRGIQQGLLHGPKALTIAPDGRILVLETFNQRVQAFDLKGNPAPSFPGDHRFNDPAGASYQADLDKRTLPDALVQQFVEHGAAHLFDMDAGLVDELDAGTMTQGLLDTFANQLVYLAYEKDGQGKIDPDPTVTSYITQVDPGQRWTITDPGRGYVYAIEQTAGGLAVSDRFTRTEVLILTEGSRWQVKDLVGARSYLLELDAAGRLSVTDYLPFFPVNPKNEKLTYCDVATESKGYVYVLAYRGDPTSGTIGPEAYVLDVFTPAGEFLFRSPDDKHAALPDTHVVAGRIALDYWRNLLTLNYEVLRGPGGRTEPTISQWSPTPPRFSLPLGTAAQLDTGNVAAVRALFSAKGTTLGPSAAITTLAASEHWRIDDAAAAHPYDLITSLGAIYVYDLPAT